MMCLMMRKREELGLLLRTFTNTWARMQQASQSTCLQTETRRCLRVGDSNPNLVKQRSRTMNQALTL
jgi:hypothetical protein